MHLNTHATWPWKAYCRDADRAATVAAVTFLLAAVYGCCTQLYMYHVYGIHSMYHIWLLYTAVHVYGIHSMYHIWLLYTAVHVYGIHSMYHIWLLYTAAGMCTAIIWPPLQVREQVSSARDQDSYIEATTSLHATRTREYFADVSRFMELATCGIMGHHA